MLDLEHFFEEKKIPLTSWEISYEGQTFTIDSDFVIQNILAASHTEQKQIANVILQIDIWHGDILGFLHYLAECYVKYNIRKIA